MTPGRSTFGRLERALPAKPMSDINMTPLIDVMLVLLVIFIVTAPLLTPTLQLNLPKADGARASDAPAFISLSADADGRWFVGAEAVDRAAVVRHVREAAAVDPDTEVHLRADVRVPYGRVAELIAAVQEGGLTRIGLVTTSPAPK